MKNLVIIFFFLCSFLLQAQAAENGKRDEPSLQVTKAFEKDFPKIKPSWRKDYGGEDSDELDFEADFTVNNTNMTAVYSGLGIFRILEIEIKTNDVPAKIRSYMEKNYPKNKIKKAAKVMTNSSKITYEIGIKINDKWVNIVFNNECGYLKMEEKDK